MFGFFWPILPLRFWKNQRALLLRLGFVAFGGVRLVFWLGGFGRLLAGDRCVFLPENRKWSKSNDCLDSPNAFFKHD